MNRGGQTLEPQRHIAAPSGVPGFLAVLLVAAPVLAATNVAVFNFQMKSDTPDWKWLEKGLSDRIATDFVQDRSLTVVARDEMQMLAQKMNWVPEMATSDPARMKEIRAGLKVEHLVTGVYEVAREQIKITGQIVEVEGRTELARQEISGPVVEVLELQRRLSAELLAWFSKQPPAQILAQLPVWTRSLPAAKALYEGMDLYDQGRYAEAWLRFRQASRADPAYMEAQYFVGKMYYFMNRYAHARRALERFVYLDRTHPRAGDAMIEYVHTYECCDVPAETLLKLYDDLGRRYPEAFIWEGGNRGRSGLMTCRDWVRFKSALLLAQVGRAKEAAVLTAPATHDANLPSPAPDGVLHLLAHHVRTAEAFPPEMVIEPRDPRARQAMLVFAPGDRELRYDLPRPTRLLGKEQKDLDRTAAFDKEQVTANLFLLAPTGHVFKSLCFFPVAGGDDGVMDVTLRLPGNYQSDVAPARSAALAEARRGGIRWEGGPRIGLLVARCVFRVSSARSGPVVVTGVRVAPVLERVASPGAIDVSCPATASFRVDVDGVFARWFPGLVGPLAPGEHVVRVYPAEADTPWGESTATVSVTAGGVTPAVLPLQWRPDGGWAGWKPMTVPQEYGDLERRLHKPGGAPAVLADGDAIRLVWSRDGDLWSAVTTDGESFSKPRKLDLPVSSAWLEKDPRLMRDAYGRFILTFQSDRNAQHRMLGYLAWSRDFVHWSAPAAVSDRYVPNCYAVMADDRGRTLWVEPDKELLRLYATSDGIRWEELAAVKSEEPKGSLWFPHLIQRPDGQYELLARSGRAYMVTERPDPNDWHGYVRRLSGDGRTWSRPQRLFDLPKVRYSWSCAVRSDKGTVLFGSSFDILQSTSRTMLVAEQPDGSWKASGQFRGVAADTASAAWHPKWGYVIAWMMPEGAQYSPHPAHGPFVMRAASLDAVLAAPGVDIQPEAPFFVPAGPRLLSGGPDADGRVTARTVENKEKVEAKGPAVPAPAPRTGVGKLTYGTHPQLESLGHSSIHLVGEEHFRKPAPGAGTVSPRALVVTVLRPPLTLAVALDATKPDALHYDIVRLDFTGQGNFASAYILPQESMRYSPATKEFSYAFLDRGLKVKLGERAYTIVAGVGYKELEGHREIHIGLYTSAEGVCRFGDKVHRVRLYDESSNLRVDDVPKTIFQDTSHEAQEGGDTFFVDRGDGKFKSYAWGLYGSPVLVDGALWNLRVSTDGGQVTAEPCAGPTGWVRINHPAWQARLAGPAMALWIYGGPDPVPVPAGRFVLVDYVEWLTADASKPRTRLVVHRTEKGDNAIDEVVVRPGGTTDITVGSPVSLPVDAVKQGEVIRFDYKVCDATGRRPAFAQNEREAPGDWNSTHVKVCDANGRPVAVCYLKTDGRTWHMEWKPPPGVCGEFRATPAIESFGFPVQPKPAIFEIK